MSDELQAPVTPPSATEVTLPPPPMASYLSFHERLVLVQLREPMTAATYPNNPVMDENGNFMGTKLLKGQCLIHAPEGIVELRTLDPLHQNLMSITLIPKDLIAYISRIEPLPNQSGYSR